MPPKKTKQKPNEKYGPPSTAQVLQKAAALALTKYPPPHNTTAPSSFPSTSQVLEKAAALASATTTTTTPPATTSPSLTPSDSRLLRKIDMMLVKSTTEVISTPPAITSPSLTPSDSRLLRKIDTMLAKVTTEVTSPYSATHTTSHQPHRRQQPVSSSGLLPVDDDGEVVPISQGETGNVSKGNISADLSDALSSTASHYFGITDGAPAAVTVKLEGGVAAGRGKMNTTKFLTTSDENQKAKGTTRLVIQDLRGIIAQPIDKEIPEMDAKHKAVIETVIKRLEELWSIDIA